MEYVTGEREVLRWLYGIGRSDWTFTFYDLCARSDTPTLQRLHGVFVELVDAYTELTGGELLTRWQNAYGNQLREVLS